MISFFQSVFKIFFSKRFVKFTLTGAFNTFNTAWISSLCALFMQENAAAGVAYAASLTIAYFVDCYMIFDSVPTKHGYIRFLLTYIPNFIIYFLVTFVTINTLNLPQFWGTILAAAVGGPITFLIMKFYTFRK